MKMTRLEWRYLQKIALDHPYYDTHGLPLTEQEAKAIVDANNKLTGREFVDSVYAKLGIPRPAEQKKRFAWLRGIGELFAVPPIRRIAIAVLIVILMAVFFAATPAGRAIAENVIRYIVSLYDKDIIIDRIDNEAALVSLECNSLFVDNGQNESIDTEACVYLTSFEDFSKDTGKTPIVLSLPFTELYYLYRSDVDYLKLSSTYVTKNGKIITNQIWGAEELSGSTLSGFALYDADRSIYYSIEKKTGLIYCIWILDDSILSITSKGSYTLDELVEMMCK